MIKLSTETTALLILAAVVFNLIAHFYVYLSPPLVKHKRFVALSWLSLLVSSLVLFLFSGSLVAVVGWVVIGIAITAFNNANTFICPKCGVLDSSAFASKEAAKHSFRSEKCRSCSFQINQKAS